MEGLQIGGQPPGERWRALLTVTGIGIDRNDREAGVRRACEATNARDIRTKSGDPVAGDRGGFTGPRGEGLDLFACEQQSEDLHRGAC